MNVSPDDIKKARALHEFETSFFDMPKPWQRDALARLAIHVLDVPTKKTKATKKRAPKENGARSGKSAQILSLLSEAPRAPIDALASEVYGEDNAVNRRRMSSILSQMQKQGLVSRVGRGAWEVVSLPAA